MIQINEKALKQITDIFNKRKKEIGLSKYFVGEMFAQGGMANVYKLSTRMGKTEYVLRVSMEHRSPYSKDIFNEREINILGELKRIRQPHVVQYLDAFVTDIPGSPRYYCSVMKLLTPLSDYMKKGEYPEIAVRLGNDLLPLLQSLSDKDILHRDIKPENIFFDEDFRNDEGFMLGDFGIAKINTATNVTPTGTESTMSPEIRGLDRELRRDKSCSDMYSLGMVMYYYLNEGVYPSNRERIDRTPPDTSSFPEPRYGSKRLKQLVVKATQYYPKDRFSSPQEMLRELQQCEEYSRYVDQNDENRQSTILALPVEDNQNTDVKFNENKASKSGESDEKKIKAYASISQKILRNKRIIFVAALLIVLSSVLLLTMNVWSNSNNNIGSDVPTLSELKDIQVGDSFTFGNYPQNSSEPEPIVWRVIDIQNGSALVISEKLLDCVAYNDTNTIVTWESSYLRKWLNNEFLNNAFTSSDQMRISLVQNINSDNSIYGTIGGKNTLDKVFVLSEYESKFYFKTLDEKIVPATPYAVKNGSYINKDQTLANGENPGWWWLRTPGQGNDYAMAVGFDGLIYEDGSIVNNTDASIRPAMWIII